MLGSLTHRGELDASSGRIWEVCKELSLTGESLMLVLVEVGKYARSSHSQGENLT